MTLQDKQKSANLEFFCVGILVTAEISVPSRFLVALSPAESKKKALFQGKRTLELAESILSPNNPLTARVMVKPNLEAHLGGKGIVRTPSDFGLMGDHQPIPAP